MAGKQKKENNLIWIISDYVYKYFLTGNKLRIQHYIASHNSYLQYLLDFGILGFIFFILIVMNLLIKLFKMNLYKHNKNAKIIAFEIATKAAFFAWIIQGMTDNNLNNKYMIITLTILIFFIHYLHKKLEIY